MPGTAPAALMAATTGANACACPSFQMPVQPGVMRPSGDTAVASTINNPAPPRARPARCTRCQSLIRPSSAEYWHIGGTAMRLRSDTSLSLNGSKSADIWKAPLTIVRYFDKYRTVKYRRNRYHLQHAYL